MALVLARVNRKSILPHCTLSNTLEIIIIIINKMNSQPSTFTSCDSAAMIIIISINVTVSPSQALIKEEERFLRDCINYKFTLVLLHLFVLQNMLQIPSVENSHMIVNVRSIWSLQTKVTWTMFKRNMKGQTQRPRLSVFYREDTNKAYFNPENIQLHHCI